MKPELYYRLSAPEKTLSVETVTDGMLEMRMSHRQSMEYHAARLREIAYQLGEQLIAAALKAGGKFVIELREESLQDFAVHGSAARRRTTVRMTPVECV